MIKTFIITLLAVLIISFNTNAAALQCISSIYKDKSFIMEVASTFAIIDDITFAMFPPSVSFDDLTMYYSGRSGEGISFNLWDDGKYTIHNHKTGEGEYGYCR